MSIHYPDVAWEGSLHAKIVAPELKPLVERLVVENTTNWLEDHPDVKDQLKKLHVFDFPFPDVWQEV